MGKIIDKIKKIKNKFSKKKIKWYRRRKKYVEVDERDQEMRQYKDSVIFKRIFKYLMPMKNRVILLMILSLLVSLTGLGYPLLISQIVDPMEEAVATGVTQAELDVIWKTIYTLGWILLIIVFANFFLKWVYQRKMAELSLHAISEIRTDLFTHAQKLSLRFYTNRPTGKILNTLINDVESVNQLVSQTVIQLLGDLVTVITTLILLLVTSIELSGFLLLFTPLIGVIMYGFAKKSRMYQRKTRATVSIMTSILQEAISGSKTIKAFVTEDVNIKNFDVATRAAKEVNLRQAKINAILAPLLQLLIALALGIILTWGAKMVESGRLDIPKLVQYFMLATGFITPFNNIANFYNTVQVAMAGGERILTMLDTKPEITEHPKSKTIKEIKGKIEFNNVNFWYEEGVPVLKNVNLKVKPNQRVAFVGFTGAGKSTLISLLSRFYDPQEGEITIDGIPLTHLSLRSFRSQMGIVLQDTYLFSGTVLENIRYGRPSATDEEVYAAAKKIGAHKFIMQLVEGYQTEVRERGSLLSVGQRQLISFARALLADPRILILDEATSSVDPYTELRIQEALETLLQNRNSFIIAHRLSTVLNSDMICVIDDGKIIQKGPHEELVKEEGLYKHLYEMQFKKGYEKSLDELQDDLKKYATTS
ncbi:MAG: ATP-binding cassette domain-containing protein [Candidatus Lokiarchaeota archaeon]|nr:ATP-binding cassette domain-containing protein [Candidatus Lokiarchaeota archaeon]